MYSDTLTYWIYLMAYTNNISVRIYNMNERAYKGSSNNFLMVRLPNFHLLKLSKGTYYRPNKAL